MIVGCVTGLVSLVHLVRAITGTSIFINDWMFPIWLSWVAVLVAGFVSYMSFKFASRD